MLINYEFEWEKHMTKKTDLVAKAEALGIKVKKSFTIADLESLIESVEIANPVELPDAEETVTEPETVAEAVDEEFRTVPNRADKRAHRRNQGRTNTGVRKGKTGARHFV